MQCRTFSVETRVNGWERDRMPSRDNHLKSRRRRPEIAEEAGFVTAAGSGTAQGPRPGVSASPGGCSLARTPERMCGLLTPRTGTERLDLLKARRLRRRRVASSATGDC